MSEVNIPQEDRRHTAVADRMAFAERLQTILAQWPSADRLARAMKVSPSAFRKWLKGEAEPSRERLVALARAAGVGIAWLADGEGAGPSFDTIGKGGSNNPEDVNPHAEWGRFVVVPSHLGPAAAGAGVPAQPSTGSFIALRQDWVRTACGVDPQNLRSETAMGESMLPTIGHGDTLLVDVTCDEVRGFGIYVLEIDGERVVKRVQRRHDGSLVLISDNTAYLPDTVPSDSSDRVKVVGRVVWTGGSV